jgi:hypothetical protein
MAKTRLNGDKIEEIDPHSADSAEQTTDAAQDGRDTVVATAATIGVVAVGAIIFEAALLPGLVLGVAAALAPQYLPRIGSALNPIFRSTVRGAYKLGQKSREAFAEAQEHFHDIAAEVDAEGDAKAKAAADVKTPAAA